MTQRESVTEESDVQIKIVSFAKITNADTEAKSEIKDLENKTVESWSHDMKGHAEKSWIVFCELAHKSAKELSKVSAPCMDDSPIYGR